MEALNTALEDLSGTLAGIIEKPSRLRKMVKEHGGDLNKAECEDIMKKAAANFQRHFRENMHKIIVESEVEQRLAEHEDMMKESQKLNEECGLTEGYRMVEPFEELELELKEVRESFVEGLQSEIRNRDESIEEKRAELANHKQKIVALEKKLLETMGQTQ